MRTDALPATTATPRRSKRLLALADDEGLVAQVQAGSEAAFEVLFERHVGGILAFCRHMLGSPEEAEDAVQQTFASAHGNLLREKGREIRLKPWLYTIARNRCLSMLRGRREQVQLDREVATAGLAEQVERRAELRELLDDIADLRPDQRAALLLAEVADLSHAEIGEVLDCRPSRVKALVFRARSSLIERREARATPCEEIREQLAVLTGGSLRRSEIRHHLRSCSGCRAYREQVKRQRQLMAAALPVLPPAWLKAHVLGAAGGGSAASAGGASVAAVGASAGAGAAAPAGSAVLAKVGVLAVLAGAGGVATEATLEHHKPAKPAGGSADTPRSAGGSPAHPGAADPLRRSGRGAGQPAGGRSSSRSAGSSTEASEAPAGHRGRGPAAIPGSRGHGVEHRSQHADGVPRGNGPSSTPPGHAPVKRKPEHLAKPAHPAHPTHPAVRAPKAQADPKPLRRQGHRRVAP